MRRNKGSKSPPLVVQGAAGWPAFLMMSVWAIYAAAAPSLRFLQGREWCCRHDFLSFRTDPVAYAFVVPRPLQTAQRTGHPQFCLCLRNQKPGPPGGPQDSGACWAVYVPQRKHTYSFPPINSLHGVPVRRLALKGDKSVLDGIYRSRRCAICTRFI